MALDSPIKEVGHKIAHIFSDYLMANDSIIDYLENRGLDRKLIEEERIGFCPPFLNYWFPLMRGRIVVPIEDVHGQVVAFAGRQYDPSASAAKDAIRNIYGKDVVEAEKKVEMWDNAKWINEPYPKIRHLYNLNNAKDSVREYNYIILVEGYFDALVMSLFGFPNTVAMCSLSLSDRHAVLISRYCKNVVLLLDGDERGAKASENVELTLQKYELSPHNIYLPSGYDPDEFIIKVGHNKLDAVINTMIAENKPKVKLNLK
jgi:DNA primase